MSSFKTIQKTNLFLILCHFHMEQVLVYGGRELTEDDREFSQSLLHMGAVKRLTTKAEGISDKMFIRTDQASLLASMVQAAMGTKTDAEAGPQPQTQQFDLSDRGAHQAASAGPQEATESQPGPSADQAPDDEGQG